MLDIVRDFIVIDRWNSRWFNSSLHSNWVSDNKYAYSIVECDHSESNINDFNDYNDYNNWR